MKVIVQFYNRADNSSAVKVNCEYEPRLDNLQIILGLSLPTPD